MADRYLTNLKKAGFTVCLFLLSVTATTATDNTWVFDEQLHKAHLLILDLQTDEARAIINHAPLPGTELQRLYLQSLSETVDILFAEDGKKFKTIEENFKQRLHRLETMPESGETLFLQAELNLQLGFNHLNLNQELNAVLAIRRASNFADDCRKKYPGFIPIKKTFGVIQVMVGSVPEKYKWFMGLLGLKGSVTVGQQQLDNLKSSKSSLSIEATILFYVIKGYISQEFEEAAKGLQDYLKKEPDNRMLMFLAANMLIKNSQSEEAYKIFQNMDAHPGGLPLYLTEYLRGEVLLQRGDYAQAIPAYEKFIVGYKSSSFKKDSYYKISLCYWLQNKIEPAKLNYEKAKVTGHDTAEPDKYAAKQLEQPSFPNARILRLRFATDGGYYKDAREIIQTITPADLATDKDKAEYYYRKGRLSQKTGEITAAKLFFRQAIILTGDNPWYFAANASLQLGYIAVSQKSYGAARKYFEQALSYKRHEYKNSIDSKAKAALEELPE